MARVAVARLAQCFFGGVGHFSSTILRRSRVCLCALAWFACAVHWFVCSRGCQWLSTSPSDLAAGPAADGGFRSTSQVPSFKCGLSPARSPTRSETQSRGSGYLHVLYRASATLRGRTLSISCRATPFVLVAAPSHPEIFPNCVAHLAGMQQQTSPQRSQPRLVRIQSNDMERWPIGRPAKCLR